MIGGGERGKRLGQKNPKRWDRSPEPEEQCSRSIVEKCNVTVLWFCYSFIPQN